MRAGLETIVAVSAAPYGYSLTVWSAGAVTMHSHGAPSLGDVFLFLAGALIGFAGLGLLAQGPLASPSTIDARSARIMAGALDMAAVGCAVGAAALTAMLHGWVAWPLGSLTATVVYLLGAAVQLAVAAKLADHLPGGYRSDR